MSAVGPDNPLGGRMRFHEFVAFIAACMALNALAMGADTGVHVKDPALDDLDPSATALVLAKAIERAEPDLVLTATESSDGYTGTVPEQVAELNGEMVLADKFVKGGGIIYVCAPCIKKRGITEDMLIDGAERVQSVDLTSTSPTPFDPAIARP